MIDTTPNVGYKEMLQMIDIEKVIVCVTLKTVRNSLAHV